MKGTHPPLVGSYLDSRRPALFLFVQLFFAIAWRLDHIDAFSASLISTNARQTGVTCLGRACAPDVTNSPIERATTSCTSLSASVSDDIGDKNGSTGDGRANGDIAPPSQIEDVASNAKLLLSNRDVSTLRRSSSELLTSLTAGLTVALAMVPEAVAFSFVAGVSPLVGLWSTVSLGLVAAALGGRAGICSSASGACSVVVAALCASHGPAYLSGCALLAGCLQTVGGLAGLGKFIRLVPHPVMLGFVNGLALVMTKAQLIHFRDAATGKFLSPLSGPGGSVYGLTALTMALVRILPKVKICRAVPPSLGAVAISSVVARVFRLPVRTLADVAGAATFRGGLSVLPKIGLPAIPWLTKPVETLGIIFPYASTMAAVGCIESLLTMQLLDGMMDDGKRGSTSKECIGQGLGNVASGLTGGIGGCALLGQSIINVESGGGTSRLSAVSMAAFLGLGIVGAAPLLGQVPVATLVGVMFLVCQSTFSWSSLRILGKIPLLDAAIIFLVSAITLKDDLAKAVVIGTITSALGFAWKQSTSIRATTGEVPQLKAESAARGGGEADEQWKSYNLNGPLFFGSVQQFSSLFDVKGDPSDVVIDFTGSRVMDHSALEAINGVADRYGSAGKRVHLRHLSPDCYKLLAKVHEGGLPPYELIESDPATDPVYEVAEESAIYSDVALSPQ